MGAPTHISVRSQRWNTVQGFGATFLRSQDPLRKSRLTGQLAYLRSAQPVHMPLRILPWTVLVKMATMLLDGLKYMRLAEVASGGDDGARAEGHVLPALVEDIRDS